ncbi:hypothetical protein H2201_001534 [Coniosporium apollinis]|uniref:DUF7624 domain-containing protein n=1 Tax=Coniosporium apollinis TaxID=61459 RepID=A0ABQ9P3C4_9PEZI|nr:hypothetical protein H2201_001534 [Coniosporium apollinis]
MIEEDVQEGEGVQEQEEIELRSPGDTEVSSPKSQTSQDMDSKKTPPLRKVSPPSSTEKSENPVVSPTTPESIPMPDDKRMSAQYTSPINTAVPLSGKPIERGTPRAQTRQEAEEEWKRRSRLSKSLEDIAETEDPESKPDSPSTEPEDNATIETMDQAMECLSQAEEDVKALKTALSECWTLCNTLAGLSSVHRERMFNYHGAGEVQEQAWRSCWKLCQKLYESRDEDHATQVRPTLELCRDFCQALFEARQRGDEASDSVLRVSFELNNHLYNTHDRNLPEPFRERTLDFYLTLCHRLMKQRTSLPEETDALLRACWSLAEMLFSLRQNNRDGKPADEELLGSAVQACWELCDLFREGWTQVRPDRGTPRPSQTSFSSSASFSSIARSDRSSSIDDSYRSAKSQPPETPTTIFDDIAEMSPEEPNVPNILVLGPETGTTRTHNRWSSSASTLSTYSDASQRTSSTATAGREDPHLSRLKTLIVKAAMNYGYARNTHQTLPAFVKALPSNSFGTLPWQMKLLEDYRKLVLADPTLRTNLPSRRVTAAEVARAVQWMSRSEQFMWLRDLFRLVFGFLPEDAASRQNITIQT